MNVRCLFTIAVLLSAAMPVGVATAAQAKAPEAPTMSTVATLKLPPHDPKLRGRASQGHPQAQYDLATLYLYGGGVK